MVEVKKAVRIALEYASDLFSSEPVIDPRLEEVSLSDDEKLWTVTISFIRPTPKSPNHQTIIDALKPPEREYKSITVDSQTGKVLSMKIRQLV
jgi:hypothetical protein